MEIVQTYHPSVSTDEHIFDSQNSRPWKCIARSLPLYAGDRAIRFRLGLIGLANWIQPLI